MRENFRNFPTHCVEITRNLVSHILWQKFRENNVFIIESLIVDLTEYFFDFPH